eukprot:5694811-Pyramimonas_sp.AAC.1
MAERVGKDVLSGRVHGRQVKGWREVLAEDHLRGAPILHKWTKDPGEGAAGVVGGTVERIQDRSACP